jgi:uncharacterized membrane protein YqjE
VLDVLFRLIPALLRHFVAYGDLLSVEAGDAVRELRRQLIGLAVVLAAGVVAALMGCVWVIAATWDGPHRLQAIGALCIGFALIALSGVWYANRGRPRGQPRPFQRLGAEWREDLRQLAALYPSLAGVEQDPAAAARELHGD